MEVAQVAGEASFIGGVALTMTAITLLVRCASSTRDAELRSIRPECTLAGGNCGRAILRVGACCVSAATAPPPPLARALAHARTPPCTHTHTLQGLAIGFVLLRVESLVEEGKL